MGSTGSDRRRFGVYEADLHTGELWKHGTRVKLAGQPFAVLAVLVRRPGELVTREELRDQLWPGDTYVDFDHGLNAAVNKLRDVLCDSAETPKYIETLPRRGYRFVAAVENIAAPATGEAVKNVEQQFTPVTREALINQPLAGLAGEGLEASITVPPTAETVTGSQRRPRWPAYLAAGIIVAAGVLAIAYWARSRGTKHETAAAGIGTPIRLSPLTTLSDRTSEPAFSPDGNRVAFRRDGLIPGNSGIWIKDVDGEQLSQLTNSSEDCCPVWSPDAHWVAFSRVADHRPAHDGTHETGANLAHRRTIYEVPAAGGPLRELRTTDFVPEHGELSWSPDGNSIAYVAIGAQGSSAIFLLALRDHTTHQLTSPSALEQDWGPAFSPNGNRLAFVRVRNIMVMAPEGGEVQRLTRENMRVMGPPAWAADGQSIVFASIDGEQPSLRRVPASGGEATRIGEGGNLAWSPAISRRGFRLACEVLSNARNIEQVDVSSPGQKVHALLTTVNGENGAPQVSPDGSKLAFQSDREGGLDIWVSDRDGQNPIQMTAIGTAGAPRWSPDGKEIAFDMVSGHDPQGPKAIFLVGGDGRPPRPLVQDGFSNAAPRWSRDGKWIYFASNRSGAWQVWKIQAWGGSPIQVTREGGFAAEESPDGKYLYYAKHDNAFPEIWRMPMGGGSETPIEPVIRALDWAAWAVVENGILYVEPGADDAPTVSFYDFSTRGVRHLTVLDEPPFWLAATHDGQTVIFDQPGQEESHIMLLENFR